MSDRAAGAQSGVASPPESLRVLIPSALGPLGIELTGEAVTRLVMVPKGKERKTFVPYTEIKSSEFLDEVLGRISEYLAGARRNLDLKYDLAAAELDEFSLRVLRETARVSYGRTATYQEVAAGAGKPRAYRQVLSILLDNPIPLVVPCHRVVTTRSGPGSYIGGVTKKKRLLKIERDRVAAG